MTTKMRLGQRGWIAVGFVLIAACGKTSFGTGAVSSPAPPGASPPAASPLSESPSPPLYQPPTAATVSPTPAPPVAGATCLVPFSEISEANGGFLVYRGGRRQDDPSSVVALPGNTPGQVGINPGLAYDRALGRWVPVPLDWLTPDGRTYVYADFQTQQIRAVSVADGTSGNVTLDGGWEVLSAADLGVYADHPPAPGAWFIPFGGVPMQVVDRGSWRRYFNGALWGMDSSRKLIEHNLTSGVETSWGTVSSVSDIAGFTTSGEPLVVTGGTLVMLHLSSAPTTVWPGAGDLGEGGRAYSDAVGIWFEVDGSRIGEQGTGIYLWTADKGAQLISSEVVHVMGNCG
jgi:hypothetical protein